MCAKQLKERKMQQPNRKGRILRDPRSGTGSSPSSGFNIGIGIIEKAESSSLPQIVHPHAPIIAKRRSTSEISTDNGSFNLQKRYNDMEIENMKLKSRLQEAELSIINYKGFLSTKSSVNNQNVSIQTDYYEDIQSTEEIDKLRNEMSHIQNENLLLRNRVATLLANQTKVSEDYEIKIQRLEESLKIANSKILPPRKTPKCKYQPKLSNINNHKEVIITELNDFNDYLVRNLETIRLRLSTMESSSSSSLSSSSSPHKLKLLTPLKVSLIDQGCSPMTPPAVAASTSPLLSSSPERERFTGTRINSPEKQQQQQQQQQHQQSVIDFVTVSTNTDPSFESHEYQELESQLQNQTFLVDSLTARLSSASKSVHGVVTKFGNEINAIKHWAHCKELVRVASLRELGLEKDRLMNELKYSKDLQGILWFCLETAEQMLLEINPQLVTKLQESRNKRISVLEKDVKEKRKDIEQRSVETCAVSTSHLESFQLKAEMKCKLAAEESQSVLLSFQNILHDQPH